MKVFVPKAGESVTEATIGALLVEEGSYVEKDTPIITLETDKAAMDVHAPESGLITFVVAEGDDVLVGSEIAEITPSEKPLAEKPDAKAEKQVENKAEGQKEAAPQVKSAAKEPKSAYQARLGLDAFLQEPELQEEPQSPPATTPQEQGAERREKMSRLRKTIARRLVDAKNDAAMLTTFNEVDMSEVMAIRSREKEAFIAKHGVKLGFMSFFVKACCYALKEIPTVNALIEDEEIVYSTNAHISIAVASDRGLVVPVIRKADTLTFAEIEQTIVDYAIKAREGKITIDEMSGGTFTITNGGTFGSLLSTPIINAPQTAILGMHAIKERPITVNGQIVSRPMMYLALSYDHRLIDGQQAVTFLIKIKEALEDPAKLFVEEF